MERVRTEEGRGGGGPVFSGGSLVMPPGPGWDCSGAGTVDRASAFSHVGEK